MYLKTILMASIALCLCAMCRTTTLAQGGWDVWTVQLRDGSRLSAAPVWSLDAKELRSGFGDGKEGKGTPVARPLIRHMSNILRNSEYRASKGAGYILPALPEGDFNRDLVVMDDGQRVFGAVMIRARNDKSGRVDVYRPVLVQNGVETDLTKVAHIKFATPLAKSKGNRSRRPQRIGRIGSAALETSGWWIGYGITGKFSPLSKIALVGDVV